MRDANGYGKIWNGARYALAHRLSWELHNGKIDPALKNGGNRSMFVCHRCDNPPCVRPDHLFLGTNSDNQFDAWCKGRKPGMKRNPRVSGRKLASLRRWVERRMPHQKMDVYSIVPSEESYLYDEDDSQINQYEWALKGELWPEV